MGRRAAVELGEGRLLLDLGFRDHDGLIASYLLPGEDGWTLVETGPTTCRRGVLDGLREAGVEPGEVRRVLVTHIHLDHSGGLGALAEDLPRAEFFAHEAGVPHLVDPSRLIDSARRAWGASADPLWGTIVPVPASRVRGLRGGESFDVRGGVLEVLATPGHARHHLAFYDARTRAILTGDGAGVLVEGLARARPAIPPPDLDLELLNTSVEAMLARSPSTVWYSHFGPHEGAVAALRRYRSTVEEWRAVALDAARNSPDVAAVARALEQHERAVAAHAGVPPPAEDRGALVSGYELAAQGLLRYFRTRGLLAG